MSRALKYFIIISALFVLLRICTGCGDDNQEINPIVVTQLQLSDSEIAAEKARCVDNNLPILASERDLCLQTNSAGCSNPSGECGIRYNQAVQYLNNAWAEIHARAMDEYNRCMVHPVESGFGEAYCLGEYHKWIDWMSFECTSGPLIYCIGSGPLP